MDGIAWSWPGLGPAWALGLAWVTVPPSSIPKALRSSSTGMLHGDQDSGQISFFR